LGHLRNKGAELKVKLFAYWKRQRNPIAQRQLRSLNFNAYCEGLTPLTHHCFVRSWKEVLQEMALEDEDKFIFIMNECFRMGIRR
jgi:hypothetical protein